MSQKERMLHDLRLAGHEGVCSSHWYATGIPNSRNRVGELDKLGYVIRSEPCRDHEAGAPAYHRYILTREPAPVQARLAIA